MIIAEARPMRRSVVSLLLLTTLMAMGQVSSAQSNLPLNTINLPAGFKIEVYASNIPGARSMTRGDNGTLFVGTRQVGEAYAITGEPNATKVRVIASVLNSPNGVAFRDGALYVAAMTRVIRF